MPQQRNGEECGIFVLYFINLFLQSAPENFSILKGYPYFVSSLFSDMVHYGQHFLFSGIISSNFLEFQMKEDWFDFEGLENFSKQIH